MISALVVAAAVAVIYAINTWKIRLVAKGKAFAAASMEAAQGFLYLYVLVEILRSADTALGIGAYVVGAFVGTIGAMLAASKNKGPLVPHHHTCCPPPGAPGAVSFDQVTGERLPSPSVEAGPRSATPLGSSGD